MLAPNAPQYPRTVGSYVLPLTPQPHQGSQAEDTVTDLTHDDVTRWLDGAAKGIAAMLPDNRHGRWAREAIQGATEAAHASLDDAGVPRETPAEQ